MTKKEPMRRCVVCFTSKPKHELIRIVKDKDGNIIIDKSGKINGRGAYICNDAECIKKALKTNRVEKELGAKLSEEAIESLMKWEEKQGGK